MSTIVLQARRVKDQAREEFSRFMLLWRYQHRVTPFRLWWRLVLKRAVDFVGAAAGVVLLSPALLVIALAVKIESRGPVFYAQERVGRFGELFKIYKFRSMQVDAEAAGPQWAAGHDDPRSTKVGAFLRRTHLDELPQLFNVLKGEMSLVGPRPERLCFVRELDAAIPKYDHRHMIRPGVTGLAQVYHRADLSLSDVKKKLRFDLLYAKRMCLLLDMRIIAWTMIVCATGRSLREQEV